MQKHVINCWVDASRKRGKMKKKAYYIILENHVLLSKKLYSDWRQIQDEYKDYKSSLEPLNEEELIDYFANDYKNTSDYPISLDRIKEFYNSEEFILYENGQLQKSDFQPITPWFIENNNTTQSNLFKELQKEIHEEHYLFKKEFCIIGRRSDQDDVALFLNKDNAIAFVHMTWKGKKEQGIWPVTKILLNKKELDSQLEYDKIEYGE